MSQPQSFKNHTRREPLYLTILALLLANVILSILNSIHRFHHHAHLGLWRIVLAFTFLLLTVMIRSYSLKVQDRVIRLEERARLAALAPPSELAELDSLTIRQYIALRFASNPELPTLARRAIRENLTPQQIKESIQTWRPDNQRV